MSCNCNIFGIFINMIHHLRLVLPRGFFLNKSPLESETAMLWAVWTVFLILEAPWRWWISGFGWWHDFVSTCQSQKGPQQRWTHKSQVKHAQLQSKRRPQITFFLRNWDKTEICVFFPGQDSQHVVINASMCPWCKRSFGAYCCESVKMPVKQCPFTNRNPRVLVTCHEMPCHWIETMKQPGWNP